MPLRQRKRCTNYPRILEKCEGSAKSLGFQPAAYFNERQRRDNTTSRRLRKQDLTHHSGRSDANLAAATLWLIFTLAHSRGGEPNGTVTPRSRQESPEK